MAASAWTQAPSRSLEWLGDERLARLAARGDQRAFAALYERHRPGLERYCSTILRNGADAEDAAQNAMVSALRALQSGTTPLKVKPWLYRIAHHEAIDLVRTRKPAEELDAASLAAATSGDAEEVAEVRRRLGQLMTDLRALTERQREALVLRELCGMGYEEIAQTLGSSPAAAQQTVFEARSALQSFGEGRALECEGVQRAMSECDGMRLRTRTLRAHIRGCPSCESFEASLRTRRRDLGLLFPPGGGAGGVLAALSRLLGGGGGEPLLAGLGLKGIAVGLAVLSGGGAVVATSVSGAGPGEPAPARPAAAALPWASAAAPSAGRAGRGADTRAGAPADGHRGAPGHGDRRPQVTSAPRPGATAGATPSGGGSQPGSPEASGDHESSSGSGAGSESAGHTGTGSAPAVPLPVGTPAPVSDGVQAAGEVLADTTQAAGQVVSDTVQAATDTAGGAVGTVTDAVGGATDAVAGDVAGATSGLPKLP